MGKEVYTYIYPMKYHDGHILLKCHWLAKLNRAYPNKVKDSHTFSVLVGDTIFPCEVLK